MLGCRIDIHTHLVHTVLHGLVEALLEFLLIDILLILSHTDGIGIDLDKFGKRVHQSSSDRDGAAHGDILVGEFLTGNLAGRID